MATAVKLPSLETHETSIGDRNMILTNFLVEFAVAVLRFFA